MAIQPIDLQTLFTQLDKVGKEQINQKDGLQIQQALQGAQEQRKTEERIQSVNESQDTGEGTERIKDRSGRSAQGQGGAGKGKHDKPEPEQGPELAVISDPSLGKNIDLSG
jgi:hypothetical protein